MRSLTLVPAALLLIPSLAFADLDLVFLLDTTGSMSGEIREAKDRVRSLSEALRSSRPGERVRVGVVAYRDQGDAYVTQVSPLSDDVEVSYTFLATLTADGGGDGPEDVLAGIQTTLRDLRWDASPGTERQVFIIADAPPHLDYPKNPTPEALIDEARERRVVVNAIGCRSLSSDGIAFFRRFAYATEGSYQHIGRVRAGEGGLTQAMLTALAPAAPEDSSRFPALRVEDLGPSSAPSAMPRGVQVVPFTPETGGCGLQVEVPSGLAPRAAPVVRRGPDALHVELALTQGAGGVFRYALSECPPPSTPIRVSF